MPSMVISSRVGSAMMGKPSSAQPWDAQISLIHSTCESTSSQLIAHSLMLRFVNSSTYLATVPSSVVQTGVKSAGWENRMPADQRVRQASEPGARHPRKNKPRAVSARCEEDWDRVRTPAVAPVVVQLDVTEGARRLDVRELVSELAGEVLLRHGESLDRFGERVFSEQQQ